jgi:hypothetical protein
VWDPWVLRGSAVPGSSGTRFAAGATASSPTPPQPSAAPVVVPTVRVKVERLLELVPHFPTATSGRDELHAGEMWNSNSLIAWLLAASGHDVDVLRAPASGRAPGWSAGLAVAAQHPINGVP